MARRQSINNKVINGDFETIPPFIAVTTSNNVIVDGTASGSVSAKQPSATKKLYQWKLNIFNTTSGSARYDESGMKVTGLAVKERVNLTLAHRIFGDLNEADDIRYNLIPVQPSTSYTLTVRIKTIVSNTFGTAGLYGANLEVIQHSGTAAVSAQNLRGTSNNKIAVTTDWTTYTMAFTTGVTTRYVNLFFGIFGNATDYADMTAWFDDLTLDTTIPSTRTLATNRVAVRDMGTALRFNGVSNVVTVANTLAVTSKEFTFSVTLKCNALPAVTGAFFRANESATITNRLVLICDTLNNLFIYRNNASGSTGSYVITGKYSRHQYFTFTHTESAAGSRTYINSVLVGQSAVNLDLNLNKIQHIGNDQGGNWFNGIIDAPRIWNRALSATEVSNLYFNNIVPGDSLVAEYLFNEASGTTALDSSGNGNNGTHNCTYTTDTPLKARTAV